MTTDFVRVYRDSSFSLYQAFSARVASLLGDLLSMSKTPIAQIEHRAKSPESLATKVARKSYAEPLAEVTDLAGVRVITYYADDVDRVVDIVRHEFRVRDTLSLDKVNELEVDEFGYRSVHLVCSTAAARRALGEWRPYDDLLVEIQVRSVLQHAWAAISHKIDYKSASQAPAELRRQLFRLSALMELADDQFLTLRDKTAVLTEQYRENIGRGELGLPINVNSLEEYFASQGRLKRWADIGAASGMADEDEGEVNDLEGTLPHLVSTLQQLGIQSVDEMDMVLTQSERDAPDILRPFTEAVSQNGWSFVANGADVANVLVTLVEVPRRGRRPEWRKAWREEVADAFDLLLGKSAPPP